MTGCVLSRTLLQILTRLTHLCLQDLGGEVRKPRKHEQRLLKNMGAHQVVLDLLKIPYDTVSGLVFLCKLRCCTALCACVRVCMCITCVCARVCMNEREKGG